MTAPQTRQATRARTWVYANRVVSVIMLYGFGLASFVVWQRGAREPLTYLVTLIPAAQAAAAMLLLALLAPGLYAGLRIFPIHFVSLPLTFVALAYASRFLTRQTPDGIRLVGQAPRFDVLWESPTFLAMVVLGSSGLLALYAMFKSPGPAPKPPPPVQ